MYAGLPAVSAATVRLLCKFAYVYVHARCLFTNLHTSINVRVSLCMHVCTGVCRAASSERSDRPIMMQACVCVCICICICLACVCVCICIFMCLCICICIYMLPCMHICMCICRAIRSECSDREGGMSVCISYIHANG